MASARAALLPARARGLPRCGPPPSARAVPTPVVSPSGSPWSADEADGPPRRRVRSVALPDVPA
jgi:hypothetical protein